MLISHPKHVFYAFQKTCFPRVSSDFCHDMMLIREPMYHCVHARTTGICEVVSMSTRLWACQREIGALGQREVWARWNRRDTGSTFCGFLKLYRLNLCCWWTNTTEKDGELYLRSINSQILHRNQYSKHDIQEIWHFSLFWSVLSLLC